MGSGRREEEPWDNVFLHRLGKLDPILVCSELALLTVVNRTYFLVSVHKDGSVSIEMCSKDSFLPELRKVILWTTTSRILFWSPPRRFWKWQNIPYSTILQALFKSFLCLQCKHTKVLGKSSSILQNEKSEEGVP